MTRIAKTGKNKEKQRDKKKKLARKKARNGKELRAMTSANGIKGAKCLLATRGTISAKEENTMPYIKK